MSDQTTQDEQSQRQSGQMVPEKKTRRKNWRDGESTALCQFVERHKTLLFGKGGHCSAPVEQRKKKYWGRASVFLKTQGFCRTEDECQRKWGDLKQRSLRYKSQRNLTGGGINPLAEVKPAMEGVLSILARETVHGVLGSSQEAGFSSSQSPEGSPELNMAAVSLLAQMTEPAPMPAHPAPAPKPAHQPLAQMTEPAPMPARPAPAPKPARHPLMIKPKKSNENYLQSIAEYLERIAVSLEAIEKNTSK